MFFVYKNKNCPVIIWDNEALLNPLAAVRYLQGRIIGTMEALANDLQNEAIIEILTLDIAKCGEMENISLDEEKVRMSIASKLGFFKGKNMEINEKIYGTTEVMLDAVQNNNALLTAERMFFWYETLTSKQKIENDNTQKRLPKLSQIKNIVYKAIGKNTTVFRASANKEMSNFITWINTESQLDSVVKAAIAHLWFVTIRPFDDSNVQIAGIITNMLLTRSDNTAHRFYSMLAQMKYDQKQYHSILEKTQNENFDVTNWMLWFFDCIKKALKTTDIILLKVLKKSKFWKIHNKTLLNNRQRLVINKLLSGIDGNLQSSKWAQMANCSTDTALRDIKDLIKKGILRQKTQGGRSTNYEMEKF
jgi:Fic family protein